MKLNYKIIWFEDDQSEFDEMSEKVSSFLESKAFNPEIIHEISDENLTKRIGEKDVDLIIIDYNLARGGKGDKLIKAIRGYDIYTEIIFYSVDYPGAREANLNDYLKGVDGIFYCRRIDVEEKAKAVITLTLRKIEDLNNMRGLVMAEVGSIDKKMLDIISLHANTLGSPQKEVLSSKIKEIIIKSLQDNLDKAQSINEIEKLLKETFFGSNLKWRSLVKVVEDLKTSKQLDSHFEVLKKLEEEVLRKRNLLAHVTEGIKDGKKILVGKESFEFNEITSVSIRKSLITHSENLDEINKKIKE